MSPTKIPCGALAAVLLLLIAACSGTAIRKHQRLKPPEGAHPLSYIRTHCIHCHGGSSAYAILGAKSLNDPQHMRTLGRDYLFKIIRDGGPAVGRKPTMPAWNQILSDPEIEAIVTQLMTEGVPPAS